MKLASVEQIKEIIPHPNADRLDLVKILGYQLVTEKGLHRAEDIVIYIQPDTILPKEEWAETYRKYSPKRVKAVKLRGEWSEGLCLSMEKFLEVVNKKIYKAEDFNIGDDVSELLNVTKYEPPVPQELNAVGRLPLGIPKTDEERWENLKEEQLQFGKVADITLKVDGQSCSFYYDLEQDKFGVLGRTLEFDDEASNNYTAHIKRYNIKDKLIEYCKEYGVSLCLRGESYGQGIQAFDANPHAKKEKGIAFFSVFNIKTREYERKGDRHYFRNVCVELDLPTVDIVEENVVLSQELIDKYSKELKKLNGSLFEGVVVNTDTGTYKIINKNYDSQK